MADSSPPITPTPKRKRGVETAITPIKFTFDVNRAEDGDGNSPRSKVAHKFRGLDLQGESGGGVGAASVGDNKDDADARKRQRGDDEMADEGAVPAEEVSSGEQTIPEPDLPLEPPRSVGLDVPDGSLQRAYPSINRLSDSQSRSKPRQRRTGTPPPSLRKKLAAKKGEGTGDEDEMEVVEPIRAALTWREDEITIYDPEDDDDDGTGINGVGFRPTPALAQARIQKRRQQMADYRKREENEARARRMQRRREQVKGEEEASKDIARRVQFMEESNRSYDMVQPS
ncbi:uncharacterized protein F5Z01DRAFT_328862 [Emericellopsis atlantica]|uniref:Uncharacterized protein n=1 Tax=Emericellopsis atlantica TaxID=2614577 RepID=A0A9P7ZG34_9HYPO|nr:uncharacterized protein F5Z01DRAFT_328862 [Emericellopsis atlantica]KAG9251012.1 hypothetical protein F5Z01DRAFT_328862 [Emericellopsis atlantica]